MPGFIETLKQVHEEKSTELDLADCDLNAIEIVNERQLSRLQILLDFSAFNNGVTELDLRGCNLHPINMHLLLEILKNFPQLNYLYLDENFLADAGLQIFAEFEGCEKLSLLSIENNGITHLGLNFLAVFLAKHNICELYLGGNPLNNSGAAVLREILMVNKTITDLGLEQCDIFPTGATELTIALSINTTLKILNLDNNPFGDAGVSAIIERANVLETVSLNNCDISDYGALLLAEALRLGVFSRLNVLELAENHITAVGLNDGASHGLAVVLVTNTHLVALYLGGNNLGDAGAAEISVLIANNRVLTNLNLRDTQITDQGLRVLAQAVLHQSDAKTLKVLTLTGNNFSPALFQEFQTNFTWLYTDESGSSDSDLETASLEAGDDLVADRPPSSFRPNSAASF